MILKMPGGRNVKVSYRDQAAQANEMLQLRVALFPLLKDSASSCRKATITGWGRPPSLCSPLWQQISYRAATF